MHPLLRLAIAALALASSSLAVAEEDSDVKTARVCAVTQSWAKRDRNLRHVLELLDEAAAQRAEIVCLPEECVPTDGGSKAAAALAAIADAARGHAFYIAANLKERDGDKLYSTSYLLGPDGKLVGKYRQSHRLPDEAIALGDELPVFDTKLGKVGLMIGTEHYWPEIPLVLALEGAELILWSNGVEPVPQSFPLDVTMRVRAFDNHVTLACASYAGELPYLCSNTPHYTGQPLARGCVVDRSGVVVADTGFRAGGAVAQVDLKRRDAVYQLTFDQDRSLFRPLVEPGLKPLAFKGAKRKLVVSIAQVGMGDGPNPNPDSDFAKTLDTAGQRGSDIIVMSEFGYATDTAEAKRTFALVAEKARKYRSYITLGGLRDPAVPYAPGRRASWAYLWDREGRVAGKYRISQYGKSTELPVFKTDFGVVGLILCGDIYSQEICRALALQGAEIILCGSQSWGASGTFNLSMQQARAIDNHVYMAAAHFPMSDISQRSYIIDPYGYVLAASPYWRNGVVTAEVDLDAEQVWFARSARPGTAGRAGYLAGYYPEFVPEKRTDLRRVLFAQRRPELYRLIIEKSLAERAISPQAWKKMETPPH